MRLKAITYCFLISQCDQVIFKPQSLKHGKSFIPKADNFAINLHKVGDIFSHS